MKLHSISKIRTNNFKDKEIMEKISNMWKYVLEELKDHKDDIYGVYYEYESNYMGDYSLSVAVVDNVNYSLEIPNDEKYEVFKVDKYDDQGVFKTWQQIWKMEDVGQLKRSYTFDFEKYQPNGEIEIYIAVDVASQMEDKLLKDEVKYSIR